ncbi:MAG: ROK family protein [Paracoccaceae bacterium]
MADNTYILIDLGGSNTRLALSDETALNPESIQKFSNAGYGCLEDIVKTYMQAQNLSKATAICVAAAGPLRDGVIKVTNLDWVICPDRLRALTQADHVGLLNDLQAQGYALNVLPLESLKHLYGPAKAKAGATKLVCGIGTGFNIAAAYPASKGVLVPPAEAGHVRLPVATPMQRELSDWITSERGFASVETVLAGNGLETLNRFFDPEHPRSASEVMQAAQDGQREARQVVTCFASVMGSYFGDLALAHLPLGGIYMIGGVSRAIAPYVTPENFGATFHDKGVFSDYMSEFPIFLVEDDFAALKGCLGYLQQSI